MSQHRDEQIGRILEMHELLNTSTKSVPNAEAGFTLLEVLVTLFVIALALLGTAGLQAYAMKVSTSGQFRTQAVILGIDLLERFEANNEAAITGAYAANPLPTAAGTDCDAADCTPAQLATFDLFQFRAKMLAELPSATATVAFAGAGPWTYTLQVNWVERLTRTSTTTTTTAGTSTIAAGGETENYSYTVSRTIYDRSIVI
jgi:type IV pilus assembly protein PilV